MKERQMDLLAKQEQQAATNASPSTFMESLSHGFKVATSYSPEL